MVADFGTQRKVKEQQVHVGVNKSVKKNIPVGHSYSTPLAFPMIISTTLNLVLSI